MAFLCGMLFGLTLYMVKLCKQRRHVAPTIPKQRHGAGNAGKVSTCMDEQTLQTVSHAHGNRMGLAEAAPDQARIKPAGIAAGATYWVYENRRAEGRKAVLHRATCRCCNDGRGLRGGTATANGRWHGPFASATLAREHAQRTGGVTRPCALCRPA
jgi:hypothetical protein